MKDLDLVIGSLGGCIRGICSNCEYGDSDCHRDELMKDALEHLKAYWERMQSIGEGGELIRRSDLLKFPIRRDHYDRENGNPHFINGIESVMEYAEYIPAVEAEPVVHAHWICDCEPYHICSNCRHKFSLFDRVPRCPNCGAHMDEQFELRTCYCPICDKHFEVRSNDSMGDCPDCGHHVVLHKVEVCDGKTV